MQKVVKPGDANCAVTINKVPFEFVYQPQFFEKQEKIQNCFESISDQAAALPSHPHPLPGTPLPGHGGHPRFYGPSLGPVYATVSLALSASRC